MKLYVAYTVLLLNYVNSHTNDNFEHSNVVLEAPIESVKDNKYAIYPKETKLVLNDLVLRVKRARKHEEEYDDDDEGGFISTGTSTDHDFLADVTACPKDYAPAPWGKCLTCAEYMQKIGKVGPGC